MAELYFCGTDMYHCLRINQKETNVKSVFKVPTSIQHVSEVEFNHFYAVYLKQSSQNQYSWFMNGLGLSETQIFASALLIKDVAACKNSIVGLSEDGSLYRIKLEADDNGELLFLKTSEIKTGEASSDPFKKVVANENQIFVLQSTPEMSSIYMVEDNLVLVAQFPDKYIVEFSVGLGHFVALSDTGALWNWGHCGRSELASSTEMNVMTVIDKPRRVEFFDDLPCIVVKVSCGGWHTLALTSEGDIYSWGWNESGQLGHNTAVTSRSDPHPVDLGSAEDPVVDIAAGSRHSLALLKSGRLFSWGRNKEGQCGFGSKDSSGEPVEISKSWNGTAAKIKCGKWSTFISVKV
ncbi:putative E3 ubiquitin-protein ligase HERC3 [Orchesella cincta]|uniref:Putative E3 ubiquitin-protein ligase HERC3 n=1 Tax=Orchesella cincta TaxID=48709 RepID=A0A1D2NJS9_ORCCI|nr:putative E3 ubiquitin-protein ligase HERC3 [Orchesella cincta]